jgi:hypothetical protein
MISPDDNRFDEEGTPVDSLESSLDLDKVSYPANKPRPDEVMVNGKRLLQLRRSRAVGKRHPAFRWQ